MRALLKYMKWGLYLLTILFVGYFIALLSNEEFASLLNDKFDFYLYLQTIHIFLSLSVLFVIWSNDLYDKWQKIDQTLIVVFFSIIGLWIWFVKFYPKFLKFEKDKLDD